jgi:nitrogen fixation/metabolism regulation signal transduction histidine kinase
VFSAAAPDDVIGVVFSLVNWSQIQELIGQPVLKDYFQGLVGPEEFSSAYGWIWASDADTIIAHADTNLYGVRVSGPEIGLPQLVEDARAGTWGLYREYTFRGERKNAAFKHTATFGWVVGVGIDNDDIFKAVRELQGLLLKATGVVLLVAVLWTLVIARRMTSPILALQQHTQAVASGDLDARIDVRSKDELGELGEAFNRMTAEIKAQREQLVKAEKDAAWREMARQVAHDIKNPLTPIKLSIDLLERARAEKSPEFDRIFDTTVQTIARQVEHLRDIASDFNALTGVHKAKPEPVEVGALVDEVLQLNAAWAAERGIAVRREGPGGRVLADPALLRRVLINLVSNAFEAMPDGGALECDVSPKGGELHVHVRDTGVGIPDDVRPHLFEPYFTTRSTGTGLGLAIARRVIEELDGTIALVPNEDGPGTLARIVLPLAPEA